ncbi:MAG: ABC transporter ATP-binding protein [Flavobacteriales bacterium]
MIQIEGVSKSYQRKLVLDDVSISLAKGQIFGLLGPNGAGKTTLIRMLNQMLSPDAGNILYHGKPLSATQLPNIGYLPEERGLYKNMAVAEHLLFLARLRGLSAAQAKINVEKWLHHFEIDSWRDKRISTLSKGMAQKVQFLAALVHEPELLILDEPLSGFDPMNVELMINEIQALKDNGCTILLSTHNMKSVDDICDAAALLHQGKVLAQDSIWNLRSQHSKGEIAVRFEGHMLAFANALWTDFELIDQKEISEGRFECMLRIRGQRTVNDLMRSLQDQVSVERIEKRLPSMQEVFVDFISQNQQTHD